MTTFTHKFEISFDGQTIEGEVEFNSDGKVSYSFTGDPTITMMNGKLITELFNTVQQFYELNGGIKLVQIKEKK